MRIYLTGAVGVQHAGGLLPQQAFPGPQGRPTAAASWPRCR
jgi:hypothetical protein